MLILKKSLTDISKVYENFKVVLGTHYIAVSMETWLMGQISCKSYISDIVLCENNTTDKVCISGNINNYKGSIIPNDHINGILNQDTSACNTLRDSSVIANQKYEFESYDQIIIWALDTCKAEHATPFNPTENGYTMMIGPNNIHIGKPNEISVSINVYGENNTIMYELMITYGGKDVYDDVFFKNSEMFKRAIDNGWTCV